MKVKRIVAPDMRQALKEVSRQLSEEAVVLSSRNLQEGGVEVLAGEPGRSGRGDAVAEAPGRFGEMLKDQQVSARGRDLRERLGLPVAREAVA